MPNQLLLHGRRTAAREHAIKKEFRLMMALLRYVR